MGIRGDSDPTSGHQLDQVVTSFIWPNNPKCVKKVTLQLLKKSVDMVLPNFIQYYFAGKIDNLCYWIDSKDRICPPWTQMKILSSKLSLQSFIMAQLPLKILKSQLWRIWSGSGYNAINISEWTNLAYLSSEFFFFF